MYKYFFILFLLLFHVFSCKRSEKVDSFELFQKRVSGEVFYGLPKFTNKEIASCFGLIVKYPTKLESKSNIASLYIVFDYNEVLFNYELKKLKENNIAVFEDSYKCFSQSFNNSAILCDTCIIKNNCIPNVNYKFALISRTLELEECKYYLISTANGEYLINDEHRQINETLNNRSYFFDPGYSNGAIVDERKKRIIYWVIVW